APEQATSPLGVAVRKAPDARKGIVKLAEVQQRFGDERLSARVQLRRIVLRSPFVLREDVPVVRQRLLGRDRRSGLLLRQIDRVGAQGVEASLYLLRRLGL